MRKPWHGHLPVRNSGDFRRGTRTGCDHRGLCGRPAGRDPLQRRRTGGSRSKRPAGNFGPFGGAAPERHGPGNPTTAGPAHQVQGSPFLHSPLRSIQEKRLLLDYHQQRLAHGMERQVQQARQNIGRLAASLDALSPFRCSIVDIPSHKGRTAQWSLRWIR